MRIAILGSKGVPGRHGVEVVVDNISSRLAAKGHEVTVFGYSSYFNKLDNYKGCTLVPVEGSTNKFLEMPSHSLKAVKIVLFEYRESFDVVHIHSTDPCMFMKKLGRAFPTVATSHGRAYLRNEVDPVRKAFSKIAERAFLQIGDVTTGVSPIDVEYYNSISASEQHIKYIPNGLPEIEPNIPFPNIGGLEAGKYILFSAGRIIPSKGLHLVQEAIESIDTDLPLVIVGGKGFDEEYYKRVRQTAQKKCIWLGFLRDEELYGVYKHAKVAVFPSLYEAQSMTLLEFLALGVDIVYSDLPENIAITGDVGLKFKSGSSDSLRIALKKTLDGKCPNDLKSRNEILLRHNWGEITKKYLQSYREAISLY